MSKPIKPIALVMAGLLPLVAQARTVTGTVRDNDDQPVIGATVKFDSGKTTVVTDIDGNFTIQLPDRRVDLDISYVGMGSQRVSVPLHDSHVNVTMQDNAELLGEVVAVGYGTQKKVNLTGAVGSVEGAKIAERPSGNLSNMLQGAVAGLNITTSSGMPGASASMNIRGTTSINSASPLVLVDGAIGDINTVNPADVASISVIKDASAAAIYGARAAFGVILVTTKQGQSNDGKATVRYNGQAGWVGNTTSTDYEHRGYWHLKLMDMFNQGANHTPYFSGYTDEDWVELLARVNDKTEHPDRPWVVEKEVNGKKMWRYYANTDWWHEMFNDNRFTTQHDLSVSGGNKAAKYYFSAGYRHTDGMAKYNTDMYNQYNLRSKVDIRMAPWATLENNTSFFGSTYTYQGDGAMENTVAYGALNAISCFTLRNPDGSLVYETPYSSYKPANGRHITMIQGLHPGTKRKYDFMTTTRLNITPVKPLTLTGDFTYQLLVNRNMTRSNYFQYRMYPGEDYKYYTSGAGYDDIKETVQFTNYYSANGLATYHDSFGSGHNVTAVAGYNFERRDYQNLDMYVMNLGVTYLNDVSLAPDLTGAKIGGGQNQYALQGIFGRVNYDWQGKYLVEVSGRYDGTSRFGAGHRWGMFPSGSLGWRFSEEGFWRLLRQVCNNGKLRLSYGSLGNQNVSDYYTFLRKVSLATFDSWAFDRNAKGKYSGVGAPVASDMTWEKANQWDLGLDLSFFNNRLQLTADGYIRDTKDMLTDGTELPAVYGAAVPKSNAADLRTRGIELSMDWNDSFKLWGRDFSYGLGGNLSNYKSVITRFNNAERLFSKGYYVGQEIGEIWGFEVDGIFASTDEAKQYASEVDLTYVAKQMDDGWQGGDLRFVDLDGDGKIGIGQNTVDNPGDRRKLGNSLPRLQYGFRANAQYMGFDASINFQGTGNHQWYPHDASMPFWGMYANYIRSSFLPVDFKDKVWSEDNTDAYFPRPKSEAAAKGTLQFVNSRYIQNLRYLRLKNLTVGYTVPRKLTSQIGVEKIRLYFTGENLHYWSPLKKNSHYIDPESCFERINSSQWNLQAYNWPKTFMFGLNVQF